MPSKPPPNYEIEHHQCRECRYQYLWDYAPDRRLHRAYHDERMNGVKLPIARNEVIVATDGDIEFLLVSPHASQVHKRRAAKIASNANVETRFDFGLYDGGSTDTQMQAHVLIARQAARGSGLLIMRRRSDPWRYSWDDYDAKRNVDPTPGERWSIDYLWVRQDIRRSGLGLRLIEQASNTVGTPLSEIGWLNPLSESAEPLVRRIAPSGIWLF